MKVALITETTPNPFNETHRVSCLRENLTSSSEGEGLETGRASIPVPRQSFTRQVTFEESRRHLGVETQRQWSDLAIARTTPALLALFSLVCLIAYRQVTTGSPLPLRLTAWYRKTEATFSAVLAMVHRSLWAAKYFLHSAVEEEPILFPRKNLEILLDQLASTA